MNYRSLFKRKLSYALIIQSPPPQRFHPVKSSQLPAVFIAASWSNQLMISRVTPAEVKTNHKRYEFSGLSPIDVERPMITPRSSFLKGIARLSNENFRHVLSVSESTAWKKWIASRAWMKMWSAYNPRCCDWNSRPRVWIKVGNIHSPLINHSSCLPGHTAASG